MSVVAERRMSRAEKVALIRQAIAEFPELTHRQRAERLGMKRSTYVNLLNDPDGSKQRARRETYNGACVDCGGETRSDGTSRSSPRCCACAAALKTVWTSDLIIEKIRAFVAMYGVPPTAYEWSPYPALARKSKKLYERSVAIWRSGTWPTRSAVEARFGSWNNAIRAAGYEPTPPHGWREHRPQVAP